jgi:hypothetical protein
LGRKDETAQSGRQVQLFRRQSTLSQDYGTDRQPSRGRSIRDDGAFSRNSSVSQVHNRILLRICVWEIKSNAHPGGCE